jgi:hypothetical protein
MTNPMYLQPFDITRKYPTLVSRGHKFALGPCNVCSVIGSEFIMIKSNADENLLL